MIKIEVILLTTDDNLQHERFSRKPIVLSVPSIPRKGERLRFLIDQEPSALLEVTEICFDERAGKKCAVIVFVQRPGGRRRAVRERQ